MPLQKALQRARTQLGVEGLLTAKRAGRGFLPYQLDPLKFLDSDLHIFLWGSGLGVLDIMVDLHNLAASLSIRVSLLLRVPAPLFGLQGSKVNHPFWAFAYGCSPT